MALNITTRFSLAIKAWFVSVWLKLRIWQFRSKLAHELSLVRRSHPESNQTLLGGISVLHTIVSLIPQDLVDHIEFSDEVSTEFECHFDDAAELFSRFRSTAIRITDIVSDVKKSGSRKSGFNINKHFESYSKKNYGFFIREIGGTKKAISELLLFSSKLIDSDWTNVLNESDCAYLDRTTVMLVKDLNGLANIIVGLVMDLKAENFTE